MAATTHGPNYITYEGTELWKGYQAYRATVKRPTGTTFVIHNAELLWNTPGGRRFDVELGNENMLQALRLAKGFILHSLNMSRDKRFTHVTLKVANMAGVAHTTTGSRRDPEIQLSGQYIENYSPGFQAALSYEIVGVLIHESVHVWQNNIGHYGDDPVFSGVIEGIADFLRLRAGYPGRHWVRKVGGVWYSGYEITAFFFDWIDRTLVPGFVNILNCKMAKPWNISFFEEITGHSVDHLWHTYQAGLTSPYSTTDVDKLIARIPELLSEASSKVSNAITGSSAHHMWQNYKATFVNSSTSVTKRLSSTELMKKLKSIRSSTR